MPRGRTVFVPAPDAVDTVEKEGQPGLRPTAEALAAAIPSFVPVQSGVAKRTYRTAVSETDKSMRVHVGSPFWHWLEYGTRWNPAYRPVETAARSLGLRWEAAGQ